MIENKLCITKSIQESVNNIQKEILNTCVKTIISLCSWTIMPNCPSSNLWGEIFLK